jgi:Fungal specific transcription factor domain
VLEALLKRVDGLERRLKDERRVYSPSNESGPGSLDEGHNGDSLPQRPQLDTNVTNVNEESAIYSPTPTRHAMLYESKFRNWLTSSSAPSPTVLPDVLLDTYFTRVHGKAYHILDETSARQRMQSNQIPKYLLNAVYAVAARLVAAFNTSLETNSPRYTTHPNGYHATVRLSEDYATRARNEVDTDNPSVDALQTLLLLSVAFIAAGKGKKAYMLLCKLFLHFEGSIQLNFSSKCYCHGYGTGVTSRARS